MLNLRLAMNGEIENADTGPLPPSASIAGLTNNPTYGQTAQIGVELTGVVANGAASAHAWTLDGVAISGATSVTYTPVAGDDEGVLRYAPTVDAATVTSAPYTVRYTPPVAGSLTPVNETQGSGTPTVNVAAGFTGSDLTYTEAVAWASITGSTLTINDEVRTDTVTITATNSGGSADVDLSVTITAAAGVPDQMSAPVVTSTGSTSVSVDRAAAPADNGSAITSYDLRYSTDQSNWTEVLGVSDPEAITGISIATQYFVQTRAVNGVGNGAWSASGSATTNATAPSQMSAPALTVTGSTSISVDRAAAPAANGSAITSYDLRHSTDETNWTTVTGITDPDDITGLTASTLYYVQTRAVNGIGAGAWSASASDTTSAAATAPAQMSAPVITITGSDSMSVDRAAAPSDGGSAITQYDLRYSTDEATWTTVTDVSDPESVTGLTASTLYYAQTRAVNAVGAGAWSVSDSDTTDAAGGWVPADIYTGGKKGFFLDFLSPYMFSDNVGGTEAGVGVAIAAVEDQSGNGNHATQSTSGQRPVVNTGGSGADFDGVDDKFTISALDIANGASQVHMIAVCDRDKSVKDDYVLSISGPTDNQQRLSLVQYYHEMRVYANAETSLVIEQTNAGALVGNQLITHVFYDAVTGNLGVYTNGSTINSMSIPVGSMPASDSAVIAIGALRDSGAEFEGVIKTAIVVADDIAAADMTEIYDHINALYGVSYSPPVWPWI